MIEDDLVDVFRAPLVRPLGNLVILAGMLENSLRELAAEFCGGSEVDAAKIMKKKGDKAHSWLRDEVMAAKKKLPKPTRVELLGRRKAPSDERVVGAFERLERVLKKRARFVHDEWSVYAWPRRGVTLGLRGVPRKDPRIVHDAANLEDVWLLAYEVRELNQIFGDVATTLRDQREQGRSGPDR